MLNGFGYINELAFDRGPGESARWQTIMAQPNQCVDSDFRCTVVLRFSNPKPDLPG